MANTAIKGRVVRDQTVNRKGIKDLEVHAYDIDPISGDDFLGKNKTDQDGFFEISYSEDDYGHWYTEWKPDIVLRIYGPGMRLLYETEEKSNISEGTYDIGEITIHEDNVNGWLVTDAMLSPVTGSAKRLTQGNEVEWLIDEEVFPKLTDAIKGATSWIYATSMNFWVGKNLITKFRSDFKFENPPQGQKINVTTVGEQLQEIMKTQAGNNVPVKIVLNNIRYPAPYIELLLLLIFFPFFVLSPFTWWIMLLRAIPLLGTLFMICKTPEDPDTLDEVKKYFEGSKVAVRAFTGQLWFGFLHAKLVSIDGDTAFIMGASLSQGYYNDRRHLIHDARHGGSLTHDVNLKLKGPAVADVERTFAALWNKLGPERDVIPLNKQNNPGTGVGVQVLRTLPGDTFSISDSGELTADYKHGETSVLEAYQRAIANAKDYVYIEDQYFTAPEIVTALIERMNSPDGSNLQVILVLNPKPDIKGYPKKQSELIRQLRNGIPGHKDRLGIYTIWSFDETKPPYNKSETPHELLSIYMHSKVAIVDDVWATVGSANIDGASLNESQIGTILGGVPVLGHIPGLSELVEALTAFFSSSVLERGKTARSTQHANPQRSSQPPRQTELNLVVYNDIAGQPKTDVITKLREQLWREHLGFMPPSSQASNFPTTKPVDGWLPLWQRTAKTKCKAINARQKHDATILEWQHETDLNDYLKALGIDTSKPTSIDVREGGEAHKFDWDTGQWQKKEDSFC